MAESSVVQMDRRKADCSAAVMDAERVDQTDQQLADLKVADLDG